jgi:hypothetical protein
VKSVVKFSEQLVDVYVMFLFRCQNEQKVTAIFDAVTFAWAEVRM